MNFTVELFVTKSVAFLKICKMFITVVTLSRHTCYDYPIFNPAPGGTLRHVMFNATYLSGRYNILTIAIYDAVVFFEKIEGRTELFAC